MDFKQLTYPKIQKFNKLKIYFIVLCTCFRYPGDGYSKGLLLTTSSFTSSMNCSRSIVPISPFA
jgi:hypothetical protein